MNANVQAVVADIETRLASLNGLREALLRFDTETLPIVQSTGREARPPAEGGPKARKQKRGGRQAGTKVPGLKSKAEPAAPPAASSGPVLRDRPTTLAGAMKAEIAQRSSFTLEQLQNIVGDKYREDEFFKSAASTSFYGNLAYWAKSGRLEKTGDGAVASFKVLDKEFFGHVEFSK